MSQQHAQAALDLIAQTKVPATDEHLTMAMQTRAMLHHIVAGKLVVVPPDQVKKPKKVKPE